MYAKCPNIDRRRAIVVLVTAWVLSLGQPPAEAGGPRQATTRKADVVQRLKNAKRRIGEVTKKLASSVRSGFSEARTRLKAKLQRKSDQREKPVKPSEQSVNL